MATHSKIMQLGVVVLMMSCALSQPVFADDLPEWIHQDCTSDGKFYYFIGYGTGDDAANALRNAVISSRQNALACIFGGTISTRVQVEENNRGVAFSSNTSVQIDYEHINWAGYEQVPGNMIFTDLKEHKVYSQYRWKIEQINKEQDRLKSLAKKIEENNTLKKEIQASKFISKEKELLIKQQKEELDKLKAHENEIANLRSKKDTVLAKLEQMKKQRADKGKEFVEMVTKLGCDVTYDDLVKLIGKPDSIEVRGVCFEKCEYSMISKWIPIIVYRYGEFGVSAYVSDATMKDSSDWDSFKTYKSDAQIVKLSKMKGSYREWWICEDGYAFVKRRLGGRN